MPAPKRIVIAGGSGFVGKAVARRLAERGDEVVILSRSPRRRVRGLVRDVYWDGKSAGPWTSEIEGAYAVINLTGKNVNCRYTRRNLAEIDASREDSVRAIATAINGCTTRPRVLVQASTTAIYGDAGDSWCDETTPHGEGIPVRTAMKWERAFNTTITPRTRRVVLRMSFVLGREGGVFELLTRISRWYMGGAVGTGRQFISWIHIDDLVRIILRALDDETMAGVYNATGPAPVTNDEFMRELRRALDRPWSPRVPAWLVHVGCCAIGTEPVLALTGRRASPSRLVRGGFTFEYTDLPAALRALLPDQAAAACREPVPKSHAARAPVV
jgi:uncharacterized protein (TIGR01777 family)